MNGSPMADEIGGRPHQEGQGWNDVKGLYTAQQVERPSSGVAEDAHTRAMSYAFGNWDDFKFDPAGHADVRDGDRGLLVPLRGEHAQGPPDKLGREVGGISKDRARRVAVAGVHTRKESALEEGVVLTRYARGNPATPHISPDGKNVAFFDEHKRRRIRSCCRYTSPRPVEEASATSRMMSQWIIAGALTGGTSRATSDAALPRAMINEPSTRRRDDGRRRR